jgi:hypothetical protein
MPASKPIAGGNHRIVTCTRPHGSAGDARSSGYFGAEGTDAGSRRRHSVASDFSRHRPGFAERLPRCGGSTATLGIAAHDLVVVHDHQDDDRENEGMVGISSPSLPRKARRAASIA